MRRSLQALVAIGLSTIVRGQQDDSYCDDLGRCFASHTTSDGIRYGFMIPETSEAPFDAIFQITAPNEVGWAGFSWGGSMTLTPLTVVWPNGDDVTVASRMAYGYAPPPPYRDATYTILDGTYTNDTHYVVTALCDGCSVWSPTGVESKLNPQGGNSFAFAFSRTPVAEPDNDESAFALHDAVGHWTQDLSSAQSAEFDEYAVGGGNGDDGDSDPTTTSARSEPATTTSGPPNDNATATPLPIPSSCGLQSAFPLKVADGWTYAKVAGSLRTPRGVTVDTSGNLLVIESGKGLTAHTFGSDGCIRSSKTVIDRPLLNHGITLTPDGKTLVVSSITTAWRYTYNAESQTVSNEQVVVKGMNPGGHPTRTTVIPPDTPNLLIVSLGSDGNLDMPSIDKNVGRALVKVFDLSKVPNGGYDYASSGWFLGYGLRNEVAIVVDNNNMVWGVENSADEFRRTVNGQSYDIHNDNPAEELNYLGDPSVSNEDWYGYPTCFTVWGGEQFPDGNPQAGSQFIPTPNGSWTDSTCEERSVAPRLSLQAHSAPLDGKFDEDGSNMYVSFHGSWNRQTPTGFKVVEIPFTQNSDGGYEPVADAHSKDGYNDILWDTQSGCSSFTCFRPSGITWDRAMTRMFIASDNAQQGEVYMLAKTG